MESIADLLGTNGREPAAEDVLPADSVYAIPEHLSSKQFAEAFLNSFEFRRYIVNSLALGDMPAAVITRMMDYAWGKPVERVSIDVPEVSEVRVIVVRPTPTLDDGEVGAPIIVAPKVVTH